MVLFGQLPCHSPRMSISSNITGVATWATASTITAAVSIKKWTTSVAFTTLATSVDIRTWIFILWADYILDVLHMFNEAEEDLRSSSLYTSIWVYITLVSLRAAMFFITTTHGVWIWTATISIFASWTASVSIQTRTIIGTRYISWSFYNKFLLTDLDACL